MIESISDVSAAEACNRDCLCATTDRSALRRGFAAAAPEAAAWLEARPNLFADTAVFLSPRDAAAMAAVITAIEGVVAMPAYAAAMVAGAPAIAAFAPRARGVFLSYDFHLGPHRPRLIEINTNAGGSLLAGAVGRAQAACCPGARAQPGLNELEARLFAMFQAEWRLERGDAAWRTVAIVDAGPEGQFLYPEFLMFRELFRRRGLWAEIVDAKDLAYRDGRLWHGDVALDMVYNRLCDFYLQDPVHRPLRDAYLAGAVVVTPHPRAHALYADKRALIHLTDGERLAAWGVSAEHQAMLLGGIPRTVAVTPQTAAALWAARNRLFFKPVAGYGSKAAYRGDKLTRRVWQEILAASYVAQDLVPPSERRLRLGGVDTPLKLDLRNFVYDGAVQLLSARLYRGQTTNFQTAGGGLAAVFLMEDEPVAAE